MKWVNLFAWLGATLPLVPYLRSDVRLLKIVWSLVGFLPFIMASVHLYMSVVIWNWPGYVKGVEITPLDILALALYLSLPRKHQQHPLPLRIAFGFYFVAVLLSAAPAITREPVLFYSWQLGRIFLLYAVTVRACANPIVPDALLTGMAAGLILEALVVLWQRFGLGMLQTPGTMDHQNMLGMLSHLVVFPFFALLLTGRAGRLPAVVFAAGVIVELMTTSRGTIGLAAIGYVFVFVLSATRGWTTRKSQILLTFVIAAAVIAPIALSAIAQRGDSEIEGSNEERVLFESAASMMLASHPLGVGANNFVSVANTEGYYLRAGVGWTSFSATVHNLYWLTVAETGYFGLAAYVNFLLAPLIIALRCGVRHRRDIRGDLLIGLGVAILLVYMQSFKEWIFITSRMQYVFVMAIGLIAGLATQMGYWRFPRPNLQPLAGVRLARTSRSSLKGFEGSSTERE
jgi:O-Antigen ligase